MRILSVIVNLIVLTVTTTAWAGTFTGLTSEAHDAAIARKVDQANVQITELNRRTSTFNTANPETPKPLLPMMTRDVYLAELWRQTLDALVQEWRASMPSLVERWKTMTDVDRAEVCVRLRIVPCPQ